MQISMWMLYDAMSNSVRSHNLGDSASVRNISGVIPYVDGIQPASEFVYLINSENITDELLACGTQFVLYGNPPSTPLSGPSHYIGLDPALNVSDALTLVLGAFERYNSWYARLQQELIGSSDLTRICELGYELLNNGIMLFDPEHVLIAYARIPPHVLGTALEQKRGHAYVLTDDAYKGMVSRPGHRDDMRAEHAAFTIDSTLERRVLYANVGPGLFDCRLCISEANRPFTKSDPQLCEILAEVLLVSFRESYVSGSSAKTHFRELLSNILREQVVDEAELDRNLKLWQWHATDRFMALRIEKHSSASGFLSSDKYVYSRIEELLGNACAFLLDGKIACIVRLEPNMTTTDTIDLLGEFMRDSIFVVGVSDEFNNILDACAYYEESTTAIRLGRTYRPTAWRHLFSDYAMLHFFKHGTSVFPAMYYCDPGVRKLMEQHNLKVDYCETLRVYLEHNCNLLHAAQALHIHRTTLFYRLNRINEMIGADLDRPEVRLRMLFSFELIEMDFHPEKYIGLGSL